MLRKGLHDGVWEHNADKHQGLKMTVTSPVIGLQAGCYKTNSG
jgi:hypothetical protein